MRGPSPKKSSGCWNAESQYPPPSSNTTNTAVFAFSLGFASSRSRMFLREASDGSSLDDCGWPSSRPSGFANDTAGSVPASMSASRSWVSLMCAARCTGSPMIDFEYWNGLQIWQYAAPIASAGLVEPFARFTAALYAPPKYAQEMFFSFSASPIVRTVDGGTKLPMVRGAPFGRKPGLMLLIM